MSQLGLVFDATAPRCPPPPAPPPHPPVAEALARAVQVPPPANLIELAEYDDTGGRSSVATYSITLHNQHFGDWCRAGLWVAIERHFGWKPHRWMASVYLELPDARRTSWGQHAIFVTQSEAAREAADLADAARGLLLSFLCGDGVETPGQRRHRAAEAHAEALPAHVRAVGLAQDEREILEAIPEGSPERCVAYRRWLSARDIAADLRRRAVQEFHDSHSWRDFA